MRLPQLPYPAQNPQEHASLKLNLLKHILAKFRGDRTRQTVYTLLHSIGAKSLWSVSCGKASLSQKTVTSKKKLPGEIPGSFVISGGEGGIRTHGGSSPHLISSQAPSTTRTPLHAAVRQVALYHRSECMARNFSALYAKGQIASLIVARPR